MNDLPNRDVDVFTEALQRPPEARTAYLEQACAGDRGMRRRVEVLLKAHAGVGNFLGEPASGIPVDESRATVAGEGPGDRIGRYKLLQQIGEGGCGVVFMAEQEEPVRRRVALKVVKPGMDSKSVIARFEAERQALALMDDRNIARVLDAGTTERGRPYFVMELVRGIKITDYCDQNSLTTAARLELFVQVCEAVQHAHQKGIIHRDIKPSNVLVTKSDDGRALPKVIDFGIAKATAGQRLTDKTLFTAFEMLIGTPAYMSPEQAEFASVDVDTRSDIYSLGVLLYELLTSTTPIDTTELLKAGLDEVRRAIRDVDPVRPSTLLGTMMAADLTTVSSRRRSEPPELISELRGDLDRVVMKALEKDRNRRYQTAASLAEDLRHYLAGEPVSARPSSARYKLQKLVSRNKLLFGGVGVVLGVLIVALCLATWSLSREKQAHYDADVARKNAEMNERRALVEAAQNLEVTRFLKEMLAGVGPSVARGRDTIMLREILDKTAGRVGRELTNQPAVEADLRNKIGGVYVDLGSYDEAEKMQRTALDIFRRLPECVDLKVAGTLLDLSVVHRLQNKWGDAEREVREAMALEEKQHRGESMPMVQMETQLALVLANRGDTAGAEALCRRAIGTAHVLGQDQSLEAIEAVNSLAMTLQARGEWAEADATFRGLFPPVREIYGDKSTFVATLDYNLANVLNQENKLAESERFCRECVEIRRNVLSSHHPWFEMALLGLGIVLEREGKWDGAEGAYSELLAGHHGLSGPENSVALEAFPGLMRVLVVQRKDTDADRLFNRYVAGLNGGGPQVGGLWRSRAEFLARRGRWPEAAAAAIRTLEILPDDHDSYHLLAPLLAENGDSGAYADLCGKIATRFRGATNPMVADQMAKDCLILPRPDADLKVAGELADRAITLGKGTPPFALFECCKALAEYRQGHWAGAVDWAERAAANPFPYSRAEASAILAMARYQLNQVGDARTALATCVDVVEKKLPKVGDGDLGGDWRDWIIVHALLAEAQRLIVGAGLPAGNPNQK